MRAPSAFTSVTSQAPDQFPGHIAVSTRFVGRARVGDAASRAGRVCDLSLELLLGSDHVRRLGQIAEPRRADGRGQRHATGMQIEQAVQCGLLAAGADRADDSSTCLEQIEEPLAHRPSLNRVRRRPSR
jgi:hypothetical protein